jgi:cytochrome c553
MSVRSDSWTPRRIQPEMCCSTFIRSKPAIITVMIVLVFTWSAVAFAGSAAAESPAVRNCTWCHGSSAEGYTPAPRLAGQRPAYLQEQIADFKAHTRDNPASKQYMWGAAAYLDPRVAHDLAGYFATLPPKPAADGRSDLVALGQSIYLTGRPEENIVACVACHGPNAQGVAAIPRIGGLAYTYLKRRLKEWAIGYHATARHPMPSVARKLSSAQIDALASYLSFVR